VDSNGEEDHISQGGDGATVLWSSYDIVSISDRSLTVKRRDPHSFCITRCKHKMADTAPNTSDPEDQGDDGGALRFATFVNLCLRGASRCSVGSQK
jgi:hypothetical protein